MYDKILIGDTETTGFKENRIVSIGLLVYEKGKRVAKKNILVNPNAEIEYGAFKVNGISNKDVKDCPTFDVVWEDIKNLFENSTWVFHNAKYDVKVLNGEFKRYGIISPKHDIICTLENAKNFISKEQIKNYKLDTVAQYFGIDFTEEQHHDAFFDTVACMKIYNKLVDLSNGNLIVKETEI